VPAANGPVIVGSAVKVPEPQTRKLPDAGSPTGLVLTAIRQAEPSFDPHRFLTGAEAAFRRIVPAFAAGERTALAPLLTEDTFNAFVDAINAREAAGETQTSAYFSTSELWDDGILDPVDTRNALGMAISASLNAPLGDRGYGVFRM